MQEQKDPCREETPPYSSASRFTALRTKEYKLREEKDADDDIYNLTRARA